MSYIAKTLVDNYGFNSRKVMADILPQSVVRTLFPVVTSLALKDSRYTYENLIDDIKFTYSMVIAEIPRTTFLEQPKDFKVPMILGNIHYDKLEREAIDAGEFDTTKRRQRMATQLRVQEDFMVLAGETTYNGVGGVSDTTNVSTAASTQLDLTDITVLKSSLNGLISQQNNAITATGGHDVVSTLPLRLGLTSDAWDRLFQMAPATDAFRNINGFTIANEILTARGGPGSGLFQSNAIGGTISKDGQQFKLSAVGTTNAVLIAKSPMGHVIAASKFSQTVDEVHDAIDINMYERWRLGAINTSYMIYSGTVDITA